MRVTISIAAAITSIGIVATASAEKAQRGVIDVATIEDGAGHARILFHSDSAIAAENFAIWRAILKFDLAGSQDLRALRINVHPVTVPWDASVVTWTRGWREPGGDFDTDVLSNSEVDLARGSGPIAVDVTNVVKEILEEKEPFHGFLITADPADGVGIKVEDLSRFAELANASLELSWRRIPPRPIEVQQDQERLGD